MDIVVEPDVYVPTINDQGQYIDTTIHSPVRCLCGSRKDKIYSIPQFSAHKHTKTHQSWLHLLNVERFNYYLTSRQLKETVDQQQRILVRLEDEVHRKTTHITQLEYKIKELSTPITSNLLD